MKLVELDRTVILRLMESFKRRDRTIEGRWCERMKVWLLQYYNKTLNLEIKPMLANAIADNFESREAIDWNFLTTLTEFVEHSVISLKNQYNNLMITFKTQFPDKLDATVKELATFATTSYKPKKVSKRVEKYNAPHF